MFTTTVGDVDIIRIDEACGAIGMLQRDLVPNLPETLWQRNEFLLVPEHMDAADGQALLAFRSWLVRSGGRTILVDTGVGNGKQRPAVPAWHLRSEDTYLANLAAAGVHPEDVDIVVNTHLHADHVGWNTRLDGETWVPTFPNARYLMPAADVEFWDPLNRPEADAGVNQNVFADSVAPVLVAGLVETWDEGRQLDAGLTIETAPGHTPGSSVVKVSSRGQHALLAGDLLHSPVQVPHDDYNSCFCEDADGARSARRQLLGWAADHRAIVLPAHLAGSGTLTVTRRGSGFAVAGATA
ncbi:MBL fold metallo-hydrolase [Paractinoplanes hotanensis]|uniref:MBL fold metallo-hydrolase n=1 Tax=Paractinoplanes hotanensis TaxID=2906497 RepID=A0ABT0YIG2_9ACTN|nr:MBL fold metallo-hydrolase [Actinoplanes hotanensis]MCM4085039.1 MBL fold metallo-hydrolase [Actinoplanes hotanensis]